MAVVTPLRPVSRNSETARPSSGSRLRVAVPPPPLPPRKLSVVERHAQEVFPCQSSTCSADASATALIPAGPFSTVVMLCRACAALLPPTIHTVPISK